MWCVHIMVNVQKYWTQSKAMFVFRTTNYTFKKKKNPNMIFFFFFEKQKTQYDMILSEGLNKRF